MTTTHYHVGHNMPGYLPGSDVDTYTDIDEAIDGLVWRMKNHADGEATWADEHDCDDIPCPTYGDDCPWNKAKEIESEVDSLEANRALVVKQGEFSTWAGDLAYWITECNDDCDMEDM